MNNDERAALSVRLAAEIASGDQSWRETVATRWAEYLRQRADQMNKQALAFEITITKEPFTSDPVIVAEYRRMVSNLRELVARERNTAKLLDAGQVALKDPAHCELVLRMWSLPA